MASLIKSQTGNRNANPQSPGIWLAMAPSAVTAVGLGLFWSQPTGLSLAVAALTLFVGGIVALFSVRYMRSDPSATNFFITLGSLVAVVLLFVLTDNAVLFGLGWLASGFLLAKLIGHSESVAEAGAASRRSLFTFLLGDAAVLAALAVLCWQAQSVQLHAAISVVSDMSAPAAVTAAVLLLVGAAARCALPPFSEWLLSSMTTPTPVSALMHAGLVNAGGFLLLRFSPVLEAAPAVRYAAVSLGLLAALWGIGVMAVRPDIKRSLAGSTVSQMGFMIMSCGLGAYAAALWHLVAHGLFKAWLFLNAGSAIGLRTKRRPALQPTAVATIAAVTLVIGTTMALAGSLGADLIPLVLAIATGLATLGTIVLGKSTAGSRITLGMILLGLVGIHVAGFAIAGTFVAKEAPSLLSPMFAVILLAAFLACWVWQTRRIRQQRSLPGALYVRLLNAGTLRPASTGYRS